MPHITPEEQIELETRSVAKMGDACFLFAKVALQMFTASPSWTTIHAIRRALKFPFHNELTHVAIQKSMGHMDKVDIEVAADLAFIEFYRLVGSKYEDAKALVNGNVFAPAYVPTTPLPQVVKRGRGRPKKVESVNA